MPTRRWYHAGTLQDRVNYQIRPIVKLRCQCGRTYQNLREMENGGFVQADNWFKDWYLAGDFVLIGPTVRSGRWQSLKTLTS